MNAGASLMRRVVSALVALALAGAAQAEDLLSIYREATVRDAQYQSARAAFQAAQERLPQGLAGLLPSVSLSANRNYNETDSSFSGSANFYSRSLNITATQPLYRKQNLVAYEQAKLQVEQAESQLAQATQDLIVRVAKAYFDVLLAQVNVELAQAQKRAIAQQLEQAKRNFEVGTATIVDTYEAQARFDLTSAQEIAARNDLEIKKRALQQIIGRYPGELARVNQDKFQLVTPTPATMDEWIELAERNSLLLKIQQDAYALAQQEVERARAGHYPTLDLTVSYSDSRGNPAFGGNFTSQSTAVGVQLGVPLFQGFATQSRVREALANQDKALQDLDNVRRTIAQNVRQAYLNVTNGIARVKALEQALVSSQSQLDSTITGQEVGVRTFVDVLNAQQQLYSARRDYFQALYDYVISFLELRRSAGVLTDQDVVAVNAYLK
ncbi:MAG: channel protein TolC [Azospira oryzae]|nr:MAG: channel protein TolC [Azospira oryzae]PZP80972.1 MAG: channel protein TolC [Azospira oryzae]